MSLALGMSFVGRAYALPFTIGDVFVSVGNSTVKEYTPSGTLVQTLNDLSGTSFTTGSAFDSLGNLYVTNFGTGTVSKFSSSGALVASSFITAANTPESIVPVSTGSNAGTFFVGGEGAANIEQFNSSGTKINTFTVAGGNGTNGTDWIDFQNANTILYDGEGNVIKSYNIATNTQNADFGTSISTSNFALRVIPSGSFAGDVLIADSLQAERFGPTGTLLQTYLLPGNLGGDFALNLDPNGTDFWTADDRSGIVWEVNIATGHIDEQWVGGPANLTFGLSVDGELTTSGPPTVPEPATLGLLGIGVAGLLAKARKRLS